MRNAYLASNLGFSGSFCDQGSGWIGSCSFVRLRIGFVIWSNACLAFNLGFLGSLATRGVVAPMCCRSVECEICSFVRLRIGFVIMSNACLACNLGLSGELWRSGEWLRRCVVGSRVVVLWGWESVLCLVFGLMVVCFGDVVLMDSISVERGAFSVRTLTEIWAFEEVLCRNLIVMWLFRVIESEWRVEKVLVTRDDVIHGAHFSRPRRMFWGMSFRKATESVFLINCYGIYDLDVLRSN